jgi:hypothetical protein
MLSYGDQRSEESISGTGISGDVIYNNLRGKERM